MMNIIAINLYLNLKVCEYLNMKSVLLRCFKLVFLLYYIVNILFKILWRELYFYWPSFKNLNHKLLGAHMNLGQETK